MNHSRKNELQPIFREMEYGYEKDRTNMAKMEKITLNSDGGDPIEYYVLEQTRIGGVNYLLLSDVADGDGEALILKDISGDGEEEGTFVTITDDEELAAVAGVFENMLEDVTIE